MWTSCTRSRASAAPRFSCAAEAARLGRATRRGPNARERHASAQSPIWMTIDRRRGLVAADGRLYDREKWMSGPSSGLRASCRSRSLPSSCWCGGPCARHRSRPAARTGASVRARSRCTPTIPAPECRVRRDGGRTETRRCTRRHACARSSRMDGSHSADVRRPRRVRVHTRARAPGTIAPTARSKA